MPHETRLDRSVRSRVGGSVLAAGAIAVGSAVGLLTAGASANVSAHATYLDINGHPVVVTIPGVPNANNGWVWFNKTVVDGPLTFTFNYNVSPDAGSDAIFNGSTSVKNSSSGSANIWFAVEFDLCPGIADSSSWGGTTNVKLVADANGGQISCGYGNTLTGVLADGVSAFTYYWCPFVMSSTGAGVAQTNATFGQPIPAAAGPATVSSIGHFGDFKLTDGDTAIFTAYTVAAGLPAAMPMSACPGDINVDGMVNGSDLAQLLLAWGDVGSCMPADVNGDGKIDGRDLGLLLLSWGSCSGSAPR